MRNLFDGLFEKDPINRLGSGLTGGEEIKRHAWFERVDWDAILDKRIKPPFVPKIKSELDVSNFDEEFTNGDVHSVTEDSSLNGK